MTRIAVNKQKIINDPVYGFISFPFRSNYDLIEHPYIQRLRRIRQLGMTNYVYPGANHTRFQHVLGAGYLMTQAIRVIRSKGHEITEAEEESAINAILLHDIGHGPFSHSLENSIIRGLNHEQLSLFFMEKLNSEFKGSLSMAIEIFTGKYQKGFLHQLVSGQLDMDRLDYLKRDSFFTGVTEGVIGSDRIIKMLNIKNDELVVDIKGIYSIEKFLVARRLMYWQVYLHKTVVSGENLLIQVLRRARELTLAGEKIFTTPSLEYFLKNDLNYKNFNQENISMLLDLFSELDDSDILSAAKQWIHQDDPVLKFLSQSFIHRKFFKIEMSNTPFDEEKIKAIKENIHKKLRYHPDLERYCFHQGKLVNNTYNEQDDKIKIMYKDGSTIEISKASDLFDFKLLSRTVTKFYLTYPK